MITHDIELAKGLGDHLMIMRSGELIASGDLHELLKSARHDLQQEIAESFQQGGEE